MTDIIKFIHAIPKAELHLHIEGTLEPEMLFELARRNGIPLEYSSVEALKKAYNFENLQSFLDLYYLGMKVLMHEQDFYDLTYAYLKKVASQNVKHVEIFFDPQGHTQRGIAFDTVINGIYKALEQGEKDFDISFGLIMCFLRDLSEASALEIFLQAQKHLDKLIGVGLDSAEIGHPPEKFKTVFDKARAKGLFVTAHAGEEGPVEYIWSALQKCHAVRIDHGVRAIEDETLIAHLALHKIALTVCPLSNIQLCVYDNMADHPIKKLLDKGVCVTINSDDPAYFGGYVNENFEAVCKAFNLGHQETIQFAKNSIQASFASDARKKYLIDKIEAL